MTTFWVHFFYENSARRVIWNIHSSEAFIMFKLGRITNQKGKCDDMWQHICLAFQRWKWFGLAWSREQEPSWNHRNSTKPPCSLTLQQQSVLLLKYLAIHPWILLLLHSYLKMTGKKKEFHYQESNYLKNLRCCGASTTWSEHHPQVTFHIATVKRDFFFFNLSSFHLHLPNVELEGSPDSF